jgi:quercetin dioxygenase-like cupin family protein
MKIANYTDSQPTEELPRVFKREVITAEDGAPNFCMRVFDVEPGSSTPSHAHDW